MSRTTSVTIGSQLDEFVGQLIATGRYGSTSEVVRSALVPEKKINIIQQPITQLQELVCKCFNLK